MIIWSDYAITIYSSFALIANRLFRKIFIAYANDVNVFSAVSDVTEC